MNVPQDLTGFVSDARAFLRDLTENNTRDWFHANKARYDTVIKRPALTLLDDLIPVLEDLAEAPVKPKLFRPHRDMRFSEDKTPYQTHMHLLWSCQDGRGWFFGLAADYATAGAGVMAFDDRIDAYREAVAGEDGADLVEILAEIAGRMDAPTLKKVPAPYADDHPRADLLRRKGLVVWRDNLEPLLERDPVEGLAATYETLAPLTDWLADL